MPRRRERTLAGRIRQTSLRTLRRLVVRARATLRGERALYFVLFIFIGIVGGVVGSLFRWLGFSFQALYFSSTAPLLEVARELPWYMKILAPAGGALLCGLVVQYLLKGSSGEGVAELMEAVVLRQRNVEMRPSLIKSLGSLFL